MGKLLSEKAKLSIRRKRKAKRLFRDIPLFAFQILSEENEGYNYQQFTIDISKRKRTLKKKAKSPLVRYGRYDEMQKYLSLWYEHKDDVFLLEAQKLRNRITKPYKMDFRIGTEIYEYKFPAFIQLNLIKKVAALKCTTFEEFDAKMNEILKYSKTS